MSDRFEHSLFRDCNLDDPFFDTLKRDYPDFSNWFRKKASSGERAYVYQDENGICAFVYLKKENEELELHNKVIPKEERLKIGTLKLEERIKGKRLGEGALGISLWAWQALKYNQIYVTVFEHHSELIALLERFGFFYVGKNQRGECVYIKDRRNIDYSDPYKAFPFINPAFRKAGYIPVNDFYHDTLFPYSELARTEQETLEMSAANGITKVYIGCPSGNLHIHPGEPVLIYRIHTGDGVKKYKSVVSSFCVITAVKEIKNRGVCKVRVEEFIKQVNNKAVFDETQLRDIYANKTTVVMIEMVYNGYFGSGNNVNYDWLKKNGFFEGYPYEIELTKADFTNILRKGGKDVQNVIVD